MMEFVLTRQPSPSPFYVFMAYCGIIALVILNGVYGLWEMCTQRIRQRIAQRIFEAVGLCLIFLPFAIIMLSTVAIVYRMDPGPFESEAYA